MLRMDYCIAEWLEIFVILIVHERRIRYTIGCRDDNKRWEVV